ncbi:Crp/Fnr family transcriptional regulator [Paenibacillus thermotolerans]|uniref:Crp/Fnr family transcriptional regulator n=1 Tax=Paenibacillus thermotolerans TaxID=3027807 RepID=UPI002367B761|nr:MULTISPECIES: Crp/Fnr family transcriptional regulator [unclassified Paenibacillus]
MEKIMSRRTAAKGSFLFWESDEADKLYYIRSGQVKLLKSTEDGKDLILSILQKGDLIAEVNGFGEASHSFSAEIVSDAEIGVIHRKELNALFAKHGDLSVPFMYWLGMTHRILQSKFRDLLLYGKPGALASTLIRLGNTYGEQDADGVIHVRLKLTNSELGDMIGATRESVNRMLSEWKDTGAIDFVDGRLVIYRIDSLRRVCNCPKAPECPFEVCRL